MPRVVYWMDHQSVAYYPTNTLRQIYQPPFAEYAILHLQVLSGSDRFANLVQWFSMLGSVIGVSLIARQFGASKSGEMIASVVAATIPMGILQSTSTQNDYVVGFELICFLYFINENREKFSWRSLAAASAALGLGILTKATAYIFAAPFLLWWCFTLVKKYKLKSWKPLLAAGLLVVLVNAGQFARNLDLFGNPIGPVNASSVGELEYANGVYSFPALISNLTRNIALHLGTSSPALTKITNKLVYLIHNAINIDESDSRTTYSVGFEMPTTSYHEDSAGNLFDILLIGIIFILVLNLRRLREMKDLLVFMLLAAAGFIIFCFYLRWQPWNSRLHLPWFLLWSPIIAITVTALFRQHWLPGLIFGCALLVTSYPWMVSNSTRPLIGPDSVLTRDRNKQYFANQPDLRNVYADAVEIATQNSCTKIGLLLSGEWEYPVWTYMKQKSTLSFRLKEVLVNNISRKYSLAADFTPCAIISRESLSADSMVIDQHSYQVAWNSSPLSVLILK